MTAKRTKPITPIIADMIRDVDEAKVKNYAVQAFIAGLKDNMRYKTGITEAQEDWLIRIFNDHVISPAAKNDSFDRKQELCNEENLT